MDVDDLYGVALDRFVPERDAVARKLRADGHREEAASLAGLRKPSVAAWAVNQVVRTQARTLADLFDAGDALRTAQTDVLAGRVDGHQLRLAAERERGAVDVLVNAARGLLSSDGHELSGAMIGRVTDTLHAAALDDDARRLVGEGRLERELRHVGLGDDPGIAAVPVKRSATKPGRLKKPPGETVKRAMPQQVEKERVAARRDARVAEAEARRLADRTARAAQLAEERRERAAKALAEADEALATARADADAAAADHRRTQERLKGT